MAAVWVVETRIEDENPGVYGPYTEAQAKRVAAHLEEEAALATDKYGQSVHPYGVLGAGAYPLSRYDQFLTGEERRQARRDAREREKELESR